MRGLIQGRAAALTFGAGMLEASRSEVNKTRQLCPGGHGLRGDLGLQFRRALQRQAAEIAADQKVSAQGNHGNEEQREPALRLHCGEHGRAVALGARILNLLDGLRLGTHSKQKKHVPLLRAISMAIRTGDVSRTTAPGPTPARSRRTLAWSLQNCFGTKVLRLSVARSTKGPRGAWTGHIFLTRLPDSRLREFFVNGKLCRLGA